VAWALRDRLFELHHSLLGLPDVAQDCRPEVVHAFLTWLRSFDLIDVR
jgi:hypothetical protein